MPSSAGLNTLLRLEKSAERLFTAHRGGRMAWHAWGAPTSSSTAATGSPRPVILLHGGVGSWKHWVLNIDSLSARRRVFAADTPGLGASDALLPSPKDPKEISEAVSDGISALLGPGTVYDLVGFSFGANLAANIAATPRGDRINKLVLVGPASLGTPNPRITLVPVRSTDKTTRMKAHAENLRRLMIRDPRRVDDLALAVQAYNSDSCRLNSRQWAGDPYVVKALTNAKQSTTVVWGERDQVAGTWMDACVEAVRKAKPDIEVRMIPEAGHWVMIEAPEAFNDVLQELVP